MFTLCPVCTQLDNAVEKSGKLVLTNWSEQIKVRSVFFLILRDQFKQPNKKEFKSTFVLP